MNDSQYIHRRSFLRRTGAAGAAVAAGPLVMGAAPKGSSVSLVIDGADPVAAAAPVQGAAKELRQALADAGFTVHRHERAEQAGKGELCIVASASAAPVAAAALNDAQISAPAVPESLALLSTSIAGRPAILACGADARGITYALLELADRVRHGAALKIATPIAERPANPVRSVMRQFVSEMYDKPWFYDREMWPRYLGMLAAQRFNRFQLAFGLGEDMLRHVQDQYFLFTYPFLMAVPGYDVRV
ncbi:MAG TPA: twin-arginine translocation signal domain-containing protein, partial [Rhizomicrobium sp.]